MTSVPFAVRSGNSVGFFSVVGPDVRRERLAVDGHVDPAPCFVGHHLDTRRLRTADGEQGDAENRGDCKNSHGLVLLQIFALSRGLACPRRVCRTVTLAIKFVSFLECLCHYERRVLLCSSSPPLPLSERPPQNGAARTASRPRSRRRAGRCSSTASRWTAGAATRSPTPPDSRWKVEDGFLTLPPETDGGHARRARHHLERAPTSQFDLVVRVAGRAGRQQRRQVLRPRGRDARHRPRIPDDRRRSGTRREGRAAPADRGVLRRARRRPTVPLKPAGEWNTTRRSSSAASTSSTG